MTTVITIPYKPRKQFIEFHKSKARWKVLVCHRRAGKTVASINEILKRALITKGNYAYIAPTYKQAKRVAWQYLLEFSRPIPNVKINNSELTIYLPNGSIIYLLGAQDPESLRGLSLSGVIFDEASQQPPNIFSEIVRPALADKGGWATWIGTPKGKNQLYRRLKRYENQDNAYTMVLKASESGILSDEELADARLEMSPEEYDQEFECSFNAFIKGAYYLKYLNEAREQGRITTVPYDKSVRVEVSFDLGMEDAMTMIFFQRVGNEIHIIDTYSKSGEGIEHYVKVMQEKGYLYSKIILPHDARARELGTGKSRYEVFRQLLPNIEIEILNADKVQDGINAVRMIFSKLWIDEKQEEFIDAIEHYQEEWDEKKGMSKGHPLHDWSSHYADALRYLAMSSKPREGRKTSSRVVAT